MVADKGVSSLRDMRKREEARAMGAVGRTMQASQVLDEMTEVIADPLSCSRCSLTLSHDAHRPTRRRPPFRWIVNSAILSHCCPNHSPSTA